MKPLVSRYPPTVKRVLSAGLPEGQTGTKDGRDPPPHPLRSDSPVPPTFLELSGVQGRQPMGSPLEGGFRGMLGFCQRFVLQYEGKAHNALYFME
ncbi:hypothetical protein B2K_40140 [Paenibacillus mucilaginosus K02]|uniref:Uncharacterized protein n=1 Tax=Paenibacillus mucilaginosus K02 TaxID=997761 RepID=R9UQ46_9BACL|nr:hypothetical protein B2K_40140 [Paenibacillus mucilaginosus K02]